MKIVCPSCAKIQEIIPDDLIGRYVKCKKCHYIFLWKDFVVQQKPNQTHKKDPKSERPDLFRKQNSA